MLVKLIPVVNFTNIIKVAFAPIFFCQKNTKWNCKYAKAAQNTFVQKGAHKMLLKLIPVVNFNNILQNQTIREIDT